MKVSLGGSLGLSYSLDVFTEDIEQVNEISKRIANYLPDVKKSNSCTMEEVCNNMNVTL